MSFKHALKTALVGSFARLNWWTGLHRFFDRVSPPRLLILYGHCVADPELNGSLHADMKIEAAHLTSLLTQLGRRYDLVTIGEGMDRLRSGTAARSMVALSMDDGYRDNLLRLVPLLEAVGARATVFLEAGAVAQRELPWLHALGWLDGRMETTELSRQLAKAIPSAADVLRACTGSNRLKRILKYDADRSERDRALGDLLDEQGGDRGAIVDELYLSRDEARALARSVGVEIGGHTVTHPVLSRLDSAEQFAEIDGGARLLDELMRDTQGGDDGGASEPSKVFAYPYGRDWDVDEASRAAAERSGYQYAVTTHDGVNVAGSAPFALRRVPIHSGTRIHMLVAEASGAFERFR